MNRKKMYIVRGSEDGNLGVYSNFKLAYQAAENYAITENEDGLAYLEVWADTKKTALKYVVSNYARAQKNKYGVTLYSNNTGHGVSSEIELFWLNS